MFRLRYVVLTWLAKKAFEQARKIFDRRGGIEGLKSDANRILEAAARPGTAAEKARAGLAALQRKPPTDAVSTEATADHTVELGAMH